MVIRSSQHRTSFLLWLCRWLLLLLFPKQANDLVNLILKLVLGLLLGLGLTLWRLCRVGTFLTKQTSQQTLHGALRIVEIWD